MSRIQNLAPVGLIVMITLAACSGAGASSVPTAASPVESPAMTESSPPSTAASAASTTNLNANTASVAELQAAFEAAGISNADKWAREVAEYRPYPDDPTWGQLRQELGKYNIDPAVLEQIIALLEV
jgi:DNA uptake protein ComE-like DNA-binding protein